MKALWIVKIGGSLAHSPYLLPWLDAITTFKAARVAVVPGGGPFADAVREAQLIWGFGDRVAHVMGLRAMEQYASMLGALNSGLAAAATEKQIEDALNSGRTPVWMPIQMIADRQDIPASWEMTSDSLAAWLANELNATRLVLVKSVNLERRSISARELQRKGIVDGCFPALTRAAPYRVDVVGPSDYARFGALATSAVSPGTEVIAEARACV